MFRRLGWYWRCCWGLVTPVGLAAILCYSLASYQPVAYNNLQLPLVAQVTRKIFVRFINYNLR